MNSRLSEIVKNEAMLWGSNVDESYHRAAAREMDVQWQRYVQPVFSRHNLNFYNTIDFACGFGRNSRKLKAAGAEKITLVDVNPDNIAYCKKNLIPNIATRVILNNGTDLSELESDSYTHVYSFDAMVHFDLEIIANYLHEFYRVLQESGTAFVHHSNYAGNPGGDFRENPHWRNFMSQDLFQHLARKARFKVVEQQTVPWGGIENIDCITLLEK